MCPGMRKRWADAGKVETTKGNGTQRSLQALRCPDTHATQTRGASAVPRPPRRPGSWAWTAGPAPSATPYSSVYGQRIQLRAKYTQEGCQGPSRPSGWNRGLPLRRRRGQGPHTTVFLPGKFHEQRSLAGYSPWGCKEWDMTEHVLSPPNKREKNCTHGAQARPEQRHSCHLVCESPRGNPACRGTFGGRRKAVRDRLALQGGTGDFP